MDNFEERILEAARSTRRYGKLDGCTFCLEASNQGCGDRVVLYVLLDPGGKIGDIRFEAKGCMLSRASVSIACDAVTGLGIENVISCAARLISSGSLIGGEESVSGEYSSSGLEDAQGLINSVRHIPLRVECVLLPWRALFMHSMVVEKGAISLIK
jgi:nitrogen fixation NifU-like protein